MNWLKSLWPSLKVNTLRYSKTGATLAIGWLMCSFVNAFGTDVYQQCISWLYRHNPAQVEVYYYTNEVGDKQRAEAIINGLKTDHTPEIRIGWTEKHIQARKRPKYLVDTIFCTPKSARYVKPILEMLDKNHQLKFNAITPSIHQDRDLLVFGHMDINDQTPLTPDEIDNAQRLCTRG